MVRHIKRIAIQILGWLFVLLGIAGLVLPVLQGILFLMIGFYLLSREYHWAQRWMEKLQSPLSRGISTGAILAGAAGTEPHDGSPGTRSRSLQRVEWWL